MTAAHGIAYISEAYPMTTDDLTMLLEGVRRFNMGVGVTGVLFHHSGRFFQYVEGSEDAVREVYARILASPRHHSLQLLLDTPLPARHFAAWHMGFCEPPVNEFQAIANDDWIGAMPMTRTTMQCPEPVALVLSYWSRWVADRPVK